MERRNNDANNRRIWQICATFGLSIGITIYILGVLIGGWLDQKFDSAPLCTIIGVLLAIFSCFARLIYSLSTIDRRSSAVHKKDDGEDN